jgi:hypothetical protein
VSSVQEVLPSAEVFAALCGMRSRARPDCGCVRVGLPGVLVGLSGVEDRRLRVGVVTTSPRPRTVRAEERIDGEYIWPAPDKPRSGAIAITAVTATVNRHRPAVTLGC